MTTTSCNGAALKRFERSEAVERLERLERIDPRWVPVGGLSPSCPVEQIDLITPLSQVDTEAKWNVGLQDLTPRVTPRRRRNSFPND